MRRNAEGFWVTLMTAALSFLLMAPADIVELFFWLSKPIHDKIPSSSGIWTFVGLCEITVGLGDRFYLFLALVLNTFLSFRRQTPRWLKVFLWVLFFVAILGAIRVETELRHVH